MGRCKCKWSVIERGAKTVLTFIFSHIGLCALVIGYSIAGAFLFNWLEQHAERRPFDPKENLERCIEDIYDVSESLGVTFGPNESAWRAEVYKRLERHEKNVTEAAIEERYNKTQADLEERWSIINSLFFCVTAITTIGFGHISPKTTNGRMVTIVYSIFGIPLMLLCLNNIGDAMATTFRFAYRRFVCSKSQQTDAALPVSPHDTTVAQAEENTIPYTPPQHYKPNRRNMLISPPISATIHRGSDLPVKTSLDTDQPNSTQIPIKPHTSTNLNFVPHSLQIDINNIISECAEYTGTPIPDISISEPPSSHSNHYPNYQITNGLKPPSLLSGRTPSTTSSPLTKEAPLVWVPREDGYLAIHPTDGQLTRPVSPSSTLPEDHSSMISLGSSGKAWTMQDSNTSVMWVPPLGEGEEYSHFIQNQSQKRPAGKTLVVYNTLSGDALQEQSKIQRKMALLQRTKHGAVHNEATTVFTDPVSGQAINGDMLGLNYRPIAPEPSDKDTRVPMMIVLAFVSGYLTIGAILFSSLEPWDFTDALYFSFITLSTIGFGDLVPGNLGYETREAQLKLVALALYLLLGLAVLAMSFSLVQEEVVLKCKAMAQYIGLKEL